MSDVDNSREYDISSVTGLIQVTRVWWPYDSSDPAHPPNWVKWYMLDDDTLYLDITTDPDGTEVIRIFYTAQHTLNGLNGASSTSIDDMGCELLIVGAASRCVLMKSRDVIDAINVSSDVSGDWESWGRERLKEFYDGLGRVISHERMVDDARVSWG